MNQKVKTLIELAIIASVYVVITYITAPLSFGAIQFRISEVLVLLCFYNKKYIIALVLGCVIANIQSPFGIYDIVFGSLATLISVFLISRSKNIWIASLYPALFNGIIIAFEIIYLDVEVLFNFSSFISLFASIAAGEIVCVTILGVLIFKQIEKHDFLMEKIKN